MKIFLFYFRNFLLLTAVLTFSSTVLSQSTDPEQGRPFVTNYSPTEYQAHTQNWGILQDDRGIIYFGNSDGLLQYDGVNWHLYQAGAKGNSVRSLALDSATGRIYVGSAGQFGYFDARPEGDLVYTPLDTLLNETQRDFHIVWTTHFTDQGIYFQSREYLFRFQQKAGADPSSWEITTWKPEQSYMFSFYLDGRYFVHQRGVGMLEMKGDSLSMIPGSEVLANDRMQVMLPLPKKTDSTDPRYLFATFQSGMYTFDKNGFQPFSVDIPAAFQNTLIYKGTSLPNGTIALATTVKGIVVMDQNGRVLERLGQNAGLRDNAVYSLLTDKTGTLWAGLDNGISKLEIGSAFTFFDEQDGINGKPLSVARHNGDLFLGTSSHLH